MSSGRPPKPWAHLPFGKQRQNRLTPLPGHFIQFSGASLVAQRPSCSFWFRTVRGIDSDHSSEKAGHWLLSLCRETAQGQGKENIWVQKVVLRHLEGEKSCPAHAGETCTRTQLRGRLVSEGFRESRAPPAIGQPKAKRRTGSLARQANSVQPVLCVSKFKVAPWTRYSWSPPYKGPTQELFTLPCYESETQARETILWI